MGRAHHLLAQRWKPVFVLFHGFILPALQQPEENLISIITGHEQTSGLNQLVSHRTQAIFSPTAAEHFERQDTPAALQHPSTPEQAGAMRPPGPVALAVAAHKAAAGPCPAPARPWLLGVAQRSVWLPASTDWCQLPAASGRAPRGSRGQGRPRTEPAGAKQQVAPAEVIRITFNGRAGSIFSPVYAEGPGAALLMLQGTRGTH